MTAPAEAFPLHWPAGRPRTRPDKRERARFKATFAAARDGLMVELQRLGARPGTVVLSTSVPVRVDGLPYANARPADGDPGVAVYFLDRGRRPMCVACDRWDRVEANVQAVRLTVEALRGLDRWGTSQMVEAAFTGFQALPAPPPAAPARWWWEVLGLVGSPHHFPTEVVEKRYAELAREHHPDRHGDPKVMAEINAAYEAFRKERGL